MKPETITLHVGAHRTGTTRLQMLLDLNSDRLHDLGICALTPPYAGKRRSNSIRRVFRRHHLAYGVLHKIPFGRFVLSNWLRAISFGKIQSLCFPETRHLVISEENICGPIFDVSTGSCIYPRLDAHLSSAANLLGGGVDRVFIGIRPYDRFLASAYAMRCIFGSKPKPFAAYHDIMANPERGWVEVISCLRQNFKGAEILVWSHEGIGADNRFYQLADTARDQSYSFPADDPVNPSPSLKAISELNKLNFWQRLLDENRDSLLARHPPTEKNGRFDPFNDLEKKNLQKLYAEDLRQIAGMEDVTLV